MAGPLQEPQAVRFGPFELDLRSCCLTRRGRQERLALQPGRLLVLLVQRRGELVTRKELHSLLWPGDTFGDFDHGLNNAINRLRESLSDSAASPRYIQTAPQRGYRFIAEVEFVAPPESAELHSVSDPDRTPIKVMQFENLSGEVSQDYLAEVLSETLISELAQFHKLKVSSGDGVSKLSDAPHTGLLVEGSVLRTGNEMRIAVELLKLPVRAPVWSQTYNLGLGETQAGMREAASTIHARVSASAISTDAAQDRTARVVAPEAFDSYLRGRFYAQHQNKADNETAISAFERAITIDPSFALAYAELAQTYVWKMFLFAPHERQWQEKAFVSIEKALSLDPHLAVAYLARGRLLWTPANHFPHTKAIRDYRRAVALNPNLDEARNQLALIYCHIGYFDDALRESQEAVLTNPNNHLAMYRTAQTFAFQGRYEQALGLLRTIPRTVNPALIGYQTAWVLFNLGRGEEASVLIDELLKNYPEDDGALFGSMQAVLAASTGKYSTARTKIHNAIETGSGYGHFHHSAYHIAIAFALMDQPEDAVKWLAFASSDGFPCYPLFEADSNLSQLRQHNCFTGFLAELKQQWLNFGEMF